MKRNRRILLMAPLLALTLLAADVVKVEQGQLSSTTATDGVRVFKGIPYAAPPTGDLRWKAPKAPAAWQGIRTANEFSPLCHQDAYAKNSAYYQPPEPMSEDCLYLNVWTPAKSAKDMRPVMVWIHGGALTRGAGSIPSYDGEALAKKGVVLVTINYRLNIFGFFAHPDLTKESDRNSSGNYGILDQVAALEWVKQNIAAFGGDPKNVTIFGESAGSWSVNLLVATPLTKGLFQRAIGESGAQFNPMPSLKEIEERGARMAGKMSVADLRAKPAEDILKMGANVAPVNVDGYLLPTDVYTIFSKGRQNDVPVLIGSNSDEGTTLFPWPANGTAESFRGQIQSQFKDNAPEALKLFPAGTPEEAKASHYALLRDQIFGWQMRTWARMQTQTGKSRAYLYYFTRVPPGPQSAEQRAFHAAEISYVFGTQNKSPRPWDAIDRKLSETMMTYWVNFATSGDPNGKSVPKWPAYSQKNDVALELGDTIKERPVPNKASLDFFDSWFASQRNGTK